MDYTPGAASSDTVACRFESTTERDSHGRPVISGVKLAADPEQAATVRRIFERYAAGHSLKRSQWISTPRTFCQRNHRREEPPRAGAPHRSGTFCTTSAIAAS
jgi:hypothetical protein